MGRAGSPIYKGELGDYDLPFVRSFQLFCPIKISIFSPITAALTGLPFAVSPVLPRSSATLRLLHPPRFNPPPRHPPYGSIDRAQPPVIPSLLTLAHPVIQPPLFSFALSFPSLPSSSPSFLSFSFPRFSRFALPFCLPSVSSLLFLRLPPPTQIPIPIFNYWLRERLWTVRKNRETKSLTVFACTQTAACVSLPFRDSSSNGATKKREIKMIRCTGQSKRQNEREEESASRERRRVQWHASCQKSETNERRMFHSWIHSWLYVQMRSCHIRVRGAL